MSTQRVSKIPYGLTLREMEIIDHICQGMSNGEIGRILKISEETVKRHVSNIFDKTGQSSRLELALFALRNGLTVINLTKDTEVTIHAIEEMFDQMMHNLSETKSLIRLVIAQAQAKATKESVCDSL